MFVADPSQDGQGVEGEIGDTLFAKKMTVNGTRVWVLATTAVDGNGNPLVGANATQPTDYKAITAGTNTATIIKGTSGRAFDITVTAQGVDPIIITDGVGGPTILEVPPNAGVGRYAGNCKAYTSINNAGSQNLPGFTITYA